MTAKTFYVALGCAALLVAALYVFKKEDDKFQSSACPGLANAIVSHIDASRAVDNKLVYPRDTEAVMYIDTVRNRLPY